MNKNNLRVRQGETLPIIWTNDEDGAETATITVSKDGTAVISHTVNFVGKVADLTLSDELMNREQYVYHYMVTLVYEDGTVEKYPDVSGCKDCTLPTLTVCEANDEEES